MAIGNVRVSLVFIWFDVETDLTTRGSCLRCPGGSDATARIAGGLLLRVAPTESFKQFVYVIQCIVTKNKPNF